MEKLTVLFVIVAVSALITAEELNRTAVVYLKNGEVEGTVTFQQVGSGSVRVFGNITGLSDGKHGFHIHEKGDVSTCVKAGGHYNPFNKQHGAPNASERHVGDLGNIVSKDKVAIIEIEDNKISLIGDYSIVGRALVIHEKDDDLGLGQHPDSKTTGNAGGRVACGVVGINNPIDKWPRGASASSTMSALSLGVVSVTAAILCSF